MQHARYTTTTRTTAHALLGTTTDASVAEQMGIPVSTLSRWRLKAQITPYRLHSATARYLDLLRQHPEGLTARQVYQALDVTRQGAYLTLHVLARRGFIECVKLPNLRCYGGRAYLLLWRLSPLGREGAPHAQTD